MLDDQSLEGLTIHVLEPTQMLRSASEFSPATILNRGDVIQLTDADVQASKNRLGVSTFECIDDDELQMLRFGKVVFGIGPWPQDLPVDRDDLESIRSVKSSKLVNRSQQIATYAGSNGDMPRGVRPALRPTW